jgi:hypothetical protein
MFSDWTAKHDTLPFGERYLRFQKAMFSGWTAKHRNRKIMFLGSKVLPVLRAGNLTAICEPIV